MTSVPSFSQVDATDTIDHSSHAINLNPLGILGGALGLSYEYLFMRHHGIFVDGSYVFPLFQKNKGYGAGVQYRFHFHPRMKSNYIGAFYTMGYAEASIPDANRVIYDFSLKSQVAGINYGWRSRLFKTKLHYDYRFGLGIPFSTFKWGKNGRPESIGSLRTRTFENIYKYSAILDLGFSVGYSF